MPKQTPDPDLGVLEFQDVEGMLSYNCKVKFPTFRKQVDIFFETNSVETFPTIAQKQFLQEVINSYDKVLHSIASHLENELGLFATDKLLSLHENFDLDTLGIPLKIEVNTKWDLSLLNRSNKSMSLLANFEGSKPVKVWEEKATRRSVFLKFLMKLIG